jgi:probable H4MPT-linked C1 transfer pathway protein
MTILGLDIGGANLKAATDGARTTSAAFPLWKSPDRLPDALRTLIGPLGEFDQLAVTMTGELADCFATKAEGVARILEAVQLVATGRPVSVWTTEGKFVPPNAATTNWKSAAAANWHALATWAGQKFVPQGQSLLIDIGSTTTDVVPLRDGVPSPNGCTDLERLLSGELLYTGVRRTPVCAVTQSVTLRGQSCFVAAELFASMHDVYLITGRVPPDENDCDTADGRPATVEHAENRLAHMLCCDRTELAPEELWAIADESAARQLSLIRNVIERVRKRPDTVILSGSGTFLAQAALKEITAIENARRIDLAKRLSPDLAEAACAYAVARLASK